MSGSEYFAFEFHSLVPVQESKTIIDALKNATLKLFGRTRDFKSVCANVVGHLPYFYIEYHGTCLDSAYPLGSKTRLQEFSIDMNSFRATLVEKIPFYNFYDGTQKFLKVECCSESVRMRLVNYVKDSPDLYLTLYEVKIIIYILNNLFINRHTYLLLFNSCLIMELWEWVWSMLMLLFSNLVLKRHLLAILNAHFQRTVKYLCIIYCLLIL